MSLNRISVIVLASLLGVAALPVAIRADEPASVATLDLDRIAVNVLRDVHNQGAELYNTGDPTGCLRIYQSAITTARPFLAHHADIQKMIDDSIADIERTDGIKMQAFKMHELIEGVRSELKKKIADQGVSELTTKKGTIPEPIKEPLPQAKDFELEVLPMPKTKKAELASGPKVAGVITLEGKALVEAQITFVSLGAPLPKVIHVETDDSGAFSTELLPTGKYVVIVGGEKVPAQYQTTGSTPLTVEVAESANDFNFDLQPDAEER